MRAIAHLDLDCFYAQVESVRLGIPDTTPLAVQQWDGLIAVNYAARSFGVKRGDRIDVAKAKCAGLKLIHVETITHGDQENSHSKTQHDRSSEKVSLERYRRASEAIFDILQDTVARTLIRPET